MEKIKIVKLVSECMRVNTDCISNIFKLKSGLTNESYSFTCCNSKYVIRIPGKGTSVLINRNNETKVYSVISKLNISDEVVYLNHETGIKITKYIENGVNCNNTSIHLIKCVSVLKKLHSENIQIDTEFNFVEKINTYEKLFLSNTNKSIYNDYYNTKDDILQLIHIVDKLKKNICLCHIDANYDNFLITENKTYLLDWEYSAMQDPDLDIAMYAVYANYNEKQLDKLMYLYYNEMPTDIVRKKIYAYVAIGAFIWSNWCEYKYSCGENFGQYMTNQYDIAKKYSRIALEMFGYEKVQRAILFAAGKGTRLQPLTNHCQKSLIKVNDKPIIEYTIEALVSRGIKNIIIISGYLSEQLEYLRYKYNITILKNNDYNTTNNITSMSTYFNFVKDNSHESTLVMDADQLILNNRCIKRYIKNCKYTTTFWKTKRNEWEFKLDNRNIVDTTCDLSTKSNFYSVIPVSYYTSSAFSIVDELVKHEIQNNNTNIYFDDVVLSLYKSQFKFDAIIIGKQDIIEIDTIEDLQYIKENINKIRRHI